MTTPSQARQALASLPLLRSVSVADTVEDYGAGREYTFQHPGGGGAIRVVLPVPHTPAMLRELAANLPVTQADRAAAIAAIVNLL